MRMPRLFQRGALCRLPEPMSVAGGSHAQPERPIAEGAAEAGCAVSRLRALRADRIFAYSMPVDLAVFGAKIIGLERIRRMLSTQGDTWLRPDRMVIGKVVLLWVMMPFCSLGRQCRT